MLSGSFCLCSIEHLKMAGSLGGLNPLLGERLFISSASRGRRVAEVTAASEITAQLKATKDREHYFVAWWKSAFS